MIDERESCCWRPAHGGSQRGARTCTKGGTLGSGKSVARDFRMKCRIDSAGTAVRATLGLQVFSIDIAISIVAPESDICRG